MNVGVKCGGRSALPPSRLLGLPLSSWKSNFPAIAILWDFLIHSSASRTFELQKLSSIQVSEEFHHPASELLASSKFSEKYLRFYYFRWMVNEKRAETFEEISAILGIEARKCVKLRCMKLCCCCLLLVAREFKGWSFLKGATFLEILKLLWNSLNFTQERRDWSDDGQLR